MPLRRFLAEKPGRCPTCRDGLELALTDISKAPSECPVCGAEIRMIEAENVNSPTAVRKPGTVQAKDAGFQVYQRNMDGTYDKQ